MSLGSFPGGGDGGSSLLHPTQQILLNKWHVELIDLADTYGPPDAENVNLKVCFSYPPLPWKHRLSTYLKALPPWRGGCSLETGVGAVYGSHGGTTWSSVAVSDLATGALADHPLPPPSILPQAALDEIYKFSGTYTCMNTFKGRT